MSISCFRCRWRDPSQILWITFDNITSLRLINHRNCAFICLLYTSRFSTSIVYYYINSKVIYIHYFFYFRLTVVIWISSSYPLIWFSVSFWALYPNCPLFKNTIQIVVFCSLRWFHFILFFWLGLRSPILVSLHWNFLTNLIWLCNTLYYYLFNFLGRECNANFLGEIAKNDLATQSQVK